MSEAQNKNIPKPEYEKVEYNGTTLYDNNFFAELFGVTPRRINQLTQEGIIKAVKVGKKRYYPLTATIKSYIGFLKERATARDKSDEEINTKIEKMKVDIRLKESQVELHELKTEIANGKYLKIEDVKLDYQRFFNQFKKFAQAMPARLITQVAGYIDPADARALEKQMNIEVASMLRAFIVAAGAGDKK